MYAVMQLLNIAGKCMLSPVRLSQLANVYLQWQLPTGICHCKASQMWHFQMQWKIWFGSKWCDVKHLASLKMICI